MIVVLIFQIACNSYHKLTVYDNCHVQFMHVGNGLENNNNFIVCTCSLVLFMNVIDNKLLYARKSAFR